MPQRSADKYSYTGEPVPLLKYIITGWLYCPKGLLQSKPALQQKIAVIKIRQINIPDI
ncbi:MAG TPA: hypothetical protein PLA68_14170 [Panacibacter sp.]|nr:hypothetical protein [Panacibacter sp.]